MRNMGSRVCQALLVVLPLICALQAPAAEKALAPTSAAAVNNVAVQREAKTVKIRLTINGIPTTASLVDSPATRDFLAMLPLTLKLDDYGKTEKIAYLPRKLSTHDAPAGVTPRAGDIAYYAPWGNLALFYRDFGYSSGLIRLGHFDAGAEALNIDGQLSISIEAIRE